MAATTPTFVNNLNSHKINIIHSVFIEQPQDAEMRLQILAFYDRCLLYEVTRFQVVGGDGE